MQSGNRGNSTMKCVRTLALLNYLMLFELTFNFANASYVYGKSRQKRLIIFPRPTAVIQMVLGFGLPFEVEKQSVTLGPFVKSLYYLPINSTQYTNPSIDIPSDRRKRAVSIRWNFYSALSAAANFLGYGGKSCVLRAICETAEIPFSDRGDIFTEIFHVLFTPSSSQEYVKNNFDHDYHAAERLGRTVKNCERLFPECKVNLMESFTQIFSHF